MNITAHKDTAAALSIERDNLTNILNSMEDGVCIVNERHEINFVIPALEKDFGPVTSRKCYEYFHDRESVCPWCKNREVMSGTSVRWEWYSEKTRKTFDLLDTPLRTVDGSLLKLEILRDITNRKRDELALKESEERFRVAFDTSPNPTAISKIDSGIIIDVNAGFSRFSGYRKEDVVGKSARDIHIWANPDDRDKLVALIRNAGEVKNMEADFRDRDGRIKTGLVSATVIFLNDQSHLLSVIQDIDDLKKTEKKQQASHRFLQISNRHSEMAPLLKEFVAEIKSLSGCEAVGMRILDRNGNIPFVAYTGFSKKFYDAELPLSVRNGNTTCMQVVRNKIDPTFPFSTPAGSFYVNGTSHFLQTSPAVDRGWPCPVCNNYGYESLALIPIRLGEEVLGLIHVADSRGGVVPLEMVKILEDAALHLGAAIKRVRAEEELWESNEDLERRVKDRTAELATTNRELVRQIAEREQAESALREAVNELRLLSSRLLSAEEVERKRIARELHDGIGQALTAIKFGIENALSSHQGYPTSLDVERLSHIIPFAQKTIEEVRRIVKDLRPSILDDLGILATINWFCREFQSIHVGICIEQTIKLAEDDIPEKLKTIIYRILQEALNNVVKHSRAKCVDLRLLKKNGMIQLMISDNGIGFNPEQVASLKRCERGFGLASMRERSELAGGRFFVISGKKTGTEIRIVWPLDPQTAQHSD
jgi:PAS domain S-box-containing protein